MKKLLFVPMLLIMLTLTVFIFSGVPAMGQNKSVADTTKQDTVIYTCTMHPEIQSDQPGTCPKCGMELVKKSEASEKQHKKHKMKMMCPMMNDMENMEKNNSAGEIKLPMILPKKMRSFIPVQCIPKYNPTNQASVRNAE